MPCVFLQKTFPSCQHIWRLIENDRLYLATNKANSQLIEMDKVDGAWSVVQTYNHKINNLDSYQCDLSPVANVDSDNDGVIDA
jgi:hypothetical protein